MSDSPIIHYTFTDEAPALATYSLLPILEAFARGTGITIETRDISLAGRILASFADLLPAAQRTPDALAELGAIAKTPQANIVKLPNISASVPQMKAAIAELQDKGFALPGYPDEPSTDAEKDAKERYDRVKGSAVNPVLREGNSDRRAPAAVKAYARAHPPRNGPWTKDSKAHVASMSHGDFFGNEKSVTIGADTTATIELVDAGGSTTVLKKGLVLTSGEIVDTTFLSRAALTSFLDDQVREAKEQGVLFSIHLKATMMKVSDPILFGYAVRAFFADVFAAHGSTFDRIGADERQGWGSMLAKVAQLPTGEREAIERDIAAAYANGPALAMVDSDKGITNLHVPSDVIIDASMPVMIRDSGKMWNASGKLQDAKAVIPDRSYAGVYAAVIEDCKKNGALDPTTLGSVANVGLMAQKAEEYGSHDKTFEIRSAGTVRVVDASGAILTEHAVEQGDIWRMCTTKDAAIVDWVKLAVSRARATRTPAVFWLDRERAHDANLLAKVEKYLAMHDTKGLEFPILSPIEATKFSLERIRRGEDTISVTGNVLRDYLTDLFPILEVGTSAKMLSIVPLMEGGGLFETGAGGSAPKHVQQFLEENHLRWDSLGEFLALAASFEHIADRYDHAAARVLGAALDAASASYLLENRAPSRKAGELDNRGSHYFLARYWARALAKQSDDAALAARFAPIADALESSERAILDELGSVQGKPVDIGGYYRPDPALATAAMRPSATFDRILSQR
ncbi:MAG: NADP-dependent isocitrate dehydrogenase [Planctomycetes bacterium]|nr:NADP-dependent isocitrate dehydrogenase [Planctomycetota bacterium]MCB9892598.1 NADP-dependent isocitrate dehydrogenase [Planctomycetota bacterium]MCB9917869.1 NADP-dependent isocitrate dehydrogenase [Planctomycetota bacterium]